MSLLATIFSDSFIILTRYFTLVYVVFLFLLLIGLVLPQNAQPEADATWFLLALVLALIAFAFLAGWFSMIGRACLTFLNSKSKPASEAEPDPTLPVMDAFSVLGEFFPGVGKHFASFAVGGFISLGMLALLLFLLQQYVDTLGDTSKLLMKMSEMDFARRWLFVNSLSMQQVMQINQALLAVMGSMFVYGLFILMTMLWPAFVIFHQNNVFHAYLQSIRQFFRDPFRILAIGAFFVGGHVVLTLLFAQGSVFMLIMLQFLLMLLQIYTVIVLFVYVLHRLGKPEDVTQGENTSASNPPRNLI